MIISRAQMTDQLFCPYMQAEVICHTYQHKDETMLSPGRAVS